MADGCGCGIVFEDFFPVLVEKLGVDGFMKELSNGFRLLMDAEKGAITLDSLKRNLDALEQKGMSDVKSMIREGDLDGDGGLDEKEFCILMFRLSPGLMNYSVQLLEESIA